MPALIRYEDKSVGASFQLSRRGNFRLILSKTGFITALFSPMNAKTRPCPSKGESNRKRRSTCDKLSPRADPSLRDRLELPQDLLDVRPPDLLERLLERKPLD